MPGINRREFLKLAGTAGIGLAAAACTEARSSATPIPSGAPSPTPTEIPPTPIEVTAAPRPSQVPTSFPKKPIRIVQWDQWDGQGAWFEAEIQRFQEAYPWITIDRARQDDVGAALQQAAQSKALPDLYFGGPSLISQSEASQWFCTPISGFADFEDFKAIFPNPKFDFAPGSNVIEKKAYTAPRELRSGWQGQVFVNLNLFEQYGIKDLPETGEEFLEACRKITFDSSGAAYGFGNGFATGWMNALFEWLGAKSFKVGGRDWRDSRSQYVKNPAFLALLELLSALTADGLVLPESYAIDEIGLRNLFAENRVAMIPGQMSFVADWKLRYPDFTHYTVLPPLQLDGQQSFACYATPGATGTPLYISAGSEHVEEAWLWFKWLHLPACGKRWVQAGHGLSIFPENNQPAEFPAQARKDYITLSQELTRIEPFPQARNLACNRVNVQPADPSFATLTKMVYDYWLPNDNIPPALEQLAATSDANWQAALAEAQNAGAKIEQADFLFPDWDPLADYETETP